MSDNTKSTELYEEIFKHFDTLNEMGVLSPKVIDKLQRVTRDDVTSNPIRWEPNITMVFVETLSDDDKEKLFQTMISIMSVLSKIVDNGYIDQYDYPEVVDILCELIRHFELPLSSDEGDYREYFSNNSPLAEDDSSY